MCRHTHNISVTEFGGSQPYQPQMTSGFLRPTPSLAGSTQTRSPPPCLLSSSSQTLHPWEEAVDPVAAAGDASSLMSLHRLHTIDLCLLHLWLVGRMSTNTLSQNWTKGKSGGFSLNPTHGHYSGTHQRCFWPGEGWPPMSHHCGDLWRHLWRKGHSDLSNLSKFSSAQFRFGSMEFRKLYSPIWVESWRPGACSFLLMIPTKEHTESVNVAYRHCHSWTWIVWQRLRWKLIPGSAGLKNMAVSWNGGTPRSSISRGFSVKNHPLGGTPHL